MSYPISILLPSFNGSKYIADQIQSIIEQSFGDFELLVHDDGSSDETVTILRSFEKHDHRIRVHASSENQGQSRCLLALLKVAQGSFIAFADQDDVWSRQKLGLLYSKLTSSSCGLTFGSSHLIDADSKSLGATLHHLAQLEIWPEDVLRILFYPVVSAHAMLVKKELIGEAAFANPLLFDHLISLEAQFADGLLFEEAAITFHRIHASNQANGDLKRGLSAPWFAPTVKFPRAVLSSGQDDRLRFYQRVRYLAHSTILPRPLQLTFAQVADACQTAWFSSLPRRLRTNRRCRELLCQALLPLASNHRDRQTAQSNISALCSSYRKRRDLDIIR